MEELFKNLYSVIKDHREDENFMTEQRIKNWVDQFDEGDREFVLEETTHIMKKRYISKKDGKSHVQEMIKFLTERYGKDSVKDFISDSYFIDNQADGKSQKMLLAFLNEILKEEYDTSLDDCNSLTPECVIYLDDFLCTGETVIKSLADADHGWLNLEHPNGGTNYENMEKNGTELILGYLAIHLKAAEKIWQRLYRQMGNKNISKHKIVRNNNFVIDNDIENEKSELNFLFPSEEIFDNQIKEWQDLLEGKVHAKYGDYTAGKSIQYRKTGYPKDEIFFTSAANRTRFEKIMLQKSMEYYNDHLHEKELVRPKPLGYGLNTDVSFGFGTLVFSWRNVPYNTPLPFWYSGTGRPSLFERVHT